MVTQEYGPFRVHFEYEGVTGFVDEFVTFFRQKDSQFPSVKAEATAVASRVAETTYNADPQTVSVNTIEYRKDYEN